LDAANVVAHADPARLKQVFWNLLRNATKFTPVGGEIFVRSWKTAATGQLCVEIRDTGVGISAEALPRIFDAFEQGKVEMTRQFGGLGLGLSIAKAVIEMHGGSISAASEGRDKGAAFTVRLNAVAADSARESPSAPRMPASPNPHVGRILVVEDHLDTANVMARLLRSSGYMVKTAHSVAAALELVAIEPFDVVVSDIGLPDATGYDLMAQIKERFDIKGIALSGYGTEEDMQRSRHAGFAEHVVKPVNMSQLEAVIQRLTTTP
jgi:two-component system CheB/CheR fusion protein